MTILNLKESTLDVDFDVREEDYNIIKRLLKGKFRVDLFKNGYIFSEQLPEDYNLLAKEYNGINFKNITLKTLNPIDIIITKTARYNARDEEDISKLFKKVKVNKEKLIKRFNEVIKTYAGNEDVFRYNFEFVLKKNFSKQKNSNL
jgi:hypothetical protein